MPDKSGIPPKAAVYPAFEILSNTGLRKQYAGVNGNARISSVLWHETLTCIPA